MEKEQFYRSQHIIKEIEHIEFDLDLLKKQVWALENNKDEKIVGINIINCTEEGTGEILQLDSEDKLEILRIIIIKKTVRLKEIYEQLKAI